MAGIVALVPFTGTAQVPPDLPDLPELPDLPSVASLTEVYVPGGWTLYNGAWLPAPEGGSGVALRLQTTAGSPLGLQDYAFAALDLPAGTRLSDIDTLEFEVLIETGGCGGGSPRFQLAVDRDGDGHFTSASQGGVDGNVFVYAGQLPNFNNCPPGEWTLYDMLDGQPRWDSTQLGGPFYGSQAAASARAGPDHQVLSASFVYDSTWLFGSSTLWFDNIQVNCFALASPTGHALSLLQAQGVLC